MTPPPTIASPVEAPTTPTSAAHADAGAATQAVSTSSPRTGQRLVVTGVLTKQSIAWEVARQAQADGAEIVLTGFGRTRRMTERAAKNLHSAVDVLELDVGSADDLAALHAELADRWGVVDGVLHAIAYAPADAIGGDFLATPRSSATTAFEVSAYSLKDLSVALLPLLKRAEHGGSVVGLDFDAAVSWPSYDWMGVAKAALESVSRYLSRYLGPEGVRVNLVAAGPLKTLAAGGIAGFDDLAAGWAEQAPLGWDAADVAPVAEVVRFLLSPASRAMTGEILHVDGGRHAMGGPVAW